MEYISKEHIIQIIQYYWHEDYANVIARIDSLSIINSDKIVILPCPIRTPVWIISFCSESVDIIVLTNVTLLKEKLYLRIIVLNIAKFIRQNLT